MPNLTKEQYDALPAKVEIDKASAYQLQDGEYVPMTDAIGKTFRALEEERQSRKTDAGELAGWKALGLSAAEAKKMVAKAKEMDKWTPEDKVREQIESFREQLTAAHGEEKKAIAAKLELRESQLRRMLRDGGLAQAIGDKGNQKLLIPALRDRLTEVEDERTGELVMRVLGPDGKTPRLSMKNPGQYMGADELVDEMRADKDWAPAFNGHGAQGAGSQGSRGVPSPAGAITLRAEDIRTKPIPPAVFEQMQKQGLSPKDVQVI